MSDRQETDILVVFPSELGWMALIGSGRVLRQLTLGHTDPKAARHALDARLAQHALVVRQTRVDHSGASGVLPVAGAERRGQDTPGTPQFGSNRPPGGSWDRHLVARLQAYASGARDDFCDVPVELGPLTEFQRRVVQHCRRIPPGKTLSYGQLAAKAGFAGAARAVGNCLAANRIPLVIPCHRVIAAGGGLGGYSAAGGIRLKRRLLDLEAVRLGKWLPLVAQAGPA